MFSVLSRRTLAVAAASVALIGFTSACGAVENAATCGEATKLFNDYATQLSSSSSDLNAINKANEDLSGKLKKLAATTDGDLATALNEMAATWAGFKIDASDPTAAVSKLGDLSKNAQEAAVKLEAAC